MFAQSFPDPSTLSNYRDFVTEHLSLDWIIDFEGKKITGHVTLHLKRVNPQSKEIVLDASNLLIKKVSHPFKQEKGSITIICDHGSPVIKVEYETTEGCSALQWLTPEQTLGKEHPFMFSQCQAIHARSLVPCQDTPSVKATFEATVTSKLPVLMSANKRTVENDVYRFKQTMAVPAYLIAIAAGNLDTRLLGPRCAVWSEPEQIEKAAWEFEPTERFLCIAEELAGPYRWERYDVLVLPASFPYGGMENPCLTFLTPSLLAGDRSLVDVVAHEIAHSWTGNLVSCASWEHFWLNEGFTMFLERKIMARLHGEAHRHFDAQLGWIELRGDIQHFGADSPKTCLCPDLRGGADPDDYFCRVPYEKGHTLLFYLETILGGASVFERYLREHLDHFAGQSIDTEQWLSFLRSWYTKHHPEYMASLAEVDWQQWLKGPGMPPVTPAYDQTLMTPCKELAKAWLSADYTRASLYHEFSPAQRCMFLDLLCQSSGPLDVARLEAEYRLTLPDNVEIGLQWFTLALGRSYEPAYEHAAQFACQHGRMKYCRPIYRLLYRVAPQLATSTFQANRAFYHPIAVAMITKDLS